MESSPTKSTGGGQPLKEWFRQALAHRIPALETALKRLAAAPADTVKAIHRIAHSIGSSATECGFPALAERASAVETAAAADIDARVRSLLDALRKESATGRPPTLPVLVVAADQDLCRSLTDALGAADRQTVCVSSAQAARSQIAQKSFGLVIVDAILPDEDGRSFIAELRSAPATSSLVVVVIDPAPDGKALGSTLEIDADGRFSKPVNPDEIAAFAVSRLRRTPERTQLALRDPLTGLPNRAAFHEMFKRALETCDPEREPVSLALVEVDNLQVLGDRHGPGAVEQLTVRVSSVLSRLLRSSDVIARWSPTAFAVLLPGEEHLGGTRAIEKIMAAMASEPFSVPGGGTFQITLSTGLVVLPGRVTVEEAVCLADRYLLAARSAGGNRVVCTRGDLETRPQRVLLVGQDALAVRVVRHLFEREGFRVDAIAQVNDEALRGLRAEPPDLVLVDDHLSIPAALAAIRQVLEALPPRSVSVVLLTSTEEATVQGLEAGAADYVLKPYSPLAFMARMRRLLFRGAPGPAAEARLATVLVVDQREDALIIAGTALHSRGGFRVLLAKGAPEGERRAALEKPDAVLLDTGLSGVDLPQYVQRLARQAGAGGAAIILSADSESAAAAFAVQSPAVKGTLEKPFKPLLLAQEIERLLGKPPAANRQPHVDDAHLRKEIQRIMEPAP